MTIPTPTDSSDNDEANEHVNFHMREIDELIKSGQTKEARDRIKSIRLIYPGNPYLIAFEERLTDVTDPEKKTAPPKPAGPQKTPEQMMEERESLESRLRSQLEAEYDARFTDELRGAELKASEMLAQEQEKLVKQRELIKEYYAKNLETIQKKLDEEYKEKLEEHDAKRYQERLSAELQKIEAQAALDMENQSVKLREEYEKKLSEANDSIKKFRANLKGEMETMFIRRLEQIQKEYDGKMELLGLNMPATKEGRIKLYHQRLSSVYLAGGPSLEQAKDLMRLKELLELTFDDHLAVEADARLEQYVKELERGMTSGKIKPTDKEALEELKKKYRLKPEEASRLEPFILEIFRSVCMTATILIADDEDDFRIPVQELIAAQGYHVIGCAGVNEALELLKKTKVDLIISDIKFLPGDPDGFKFFKSVISDPKINGTPFIFLSSLTDDVIVRSGMQLGIDDYLTKPIDPDMLVAVVEGRMRRLRRPK
jgi:CheY-like chemotaxis protein